MHTTAIEAMRLYCVYAGTLGTIKKMKNKIFTSIVFLFLAFLFFAKINTNYDWFKLRNRIESSNKESEERKLEKLKWINLVDSIYAISDNSYKESISFIDNQIEKYSYSIRKLEDLNFIKGNIQYKYEKINEAIKSLKTYNNFKKKEYPKYLGLMGGCLLKKGHLKTAERYLKSASQQNHGYKWHLGNYYEVLKKENLAVKEYEYLLSQDSVFYQKCKVRIDELSKEPPNYLNEIIYSDDRKRVFFHIDGLRL